MCLSAALVAVNVMWTKKLLFVNRVVYHTNWLMKRRKNNGNFLFCIDFDFRFWSNFWD